jgi:hypothetical protein
MKKLIAIIALWIPLWLSAQSTSKISTTHKTFKNKTIKRKTSTIIRNQLTIRTVVIPSANLPDITLPMLICKQNDTTIVVSCDEGASYTIKSQDGQIIKWINFDVSVDKYDRPTRIVMEQPMQFKCDKESVHKVTQHRLINNGVLVVYYKIDER